MKNKAWMEANRQAWEEVAPRHRARNFEQLLERFRTPGYSCLGPGIQKLLGDVGYRQKSIAQLCCNDGRELVSLGNTGAGRCTGFDFSREFILQARQLAAVAGADCEFVESDVYSIPAEYDAAFDIVLVSVGTLRWLQDLNGFVAVAARLLKGQGLLLIREMHPILDMFESDRESEGMTVKYSYFREQPIERTGGLDYYTNETYPSSPAWQFHHKMSDILSAVIGNQLKLLHFREYPQDISWGYRTLEQSGSGFPMSYSLLARKPA